METRRIRDGKNGENNEKQNGSKILSFFKNLGIIVGVFVSILALWTAIDTTYTKGLQLDKEIKKLEKEKEEYRKDAELAGLAAAYSEERVAIVEAKREEKFNETIISIEKYRAEQEKHKKDALKGQNLIENVKLKLEEKKLAIEREKISREQMERLYAARQDERHEMELCLLNLSNGDDWDINILKIDEYLSYADSSGFEFIFNSLNVVFFQEESTSRLMDLVGVYGKYKERNGQYSLNRLQYNLEDTMAQYYRKIQRLFYASLDFRRHSFQCYRLDKARLGIENMVEPTIHVSETLYVDDAYRIGENELYFILMHYLLNRKDERFVNLSYQGNSYNQWKFLLDPIQGVIQHYDECPNPIGIIESVNRFIQDKEFHKIELGLFKQFLLLNCI